MFEEVKRDFHDYHMRLKKQEKELLLLCQREKSCVNELTHMHEKVEYFTDLGKDMRVKIDTHEEEVLAKTKMLHQEHLKRFE